MRRAASSTCRSKCCSVTARTRQGVAGGKATPELRAALAEMRLIARRHLAKAQERLRAAAPR